LKKLQIDNGHFSLETTGYFLPLRELRVNCQLNPSSQDIFPYENIEKLTTLVLSKTRHNTNKIGKILYTLAAAPKLEHLELDCNKVTLNNELSKYLSDAQYLKFVKLQNVSLFMGIDWLQGLLKNRTIENFSVMFDKPDEKGIKKSKFLPQGK
jgi:hypothetical protein